MCGYRRLGFTLLELLTVIVIMMILVTLLLPVLGRARYHAKVVLCVSNLRQWTVALASYAETNNGQFPTAEAPGCGRNAWDIPNEVYHELRRGQGLDHELFQCPLTRHRTEAEFLVLSAYATIGYGYWVQRLAADWPPDNVAGPKSVTDNARLGNPMVADSVVLDPGTLIPCTSPVAGYDWTYGVPHAYGGNWLSLSHAYADGRVELIPWQPWQRCWPRFTSCNADNWY